MFVSGKKAQWSYLVSRVRVIKRKLMPADEFRKLLMMSFDEIVKFLEETEYKKEIDELSIKYEGPKLMDYALTLNLYRTYKRLFDVAVGLPRDLLDLYLKKFVIYNIMTIVKGKIAKMPEEEIEESLIPVGYEYDFYKSLLTKDIEEVSRVLEGTPFHEPLSRMTPDNLGEIEDEIYKVYYSRLATLPSVDPTIIPFTLFIRKEIDIKNIKTILRLRLEEASVDEILPRIIQTGYEITLDEARKLASMSWDELTRSLEGYWFGKELEGIEEKSLSRIEVKFDRAWIKLIAKIASNYPLSILPILQYITLKKVEVDNLRIIGWGKWNNIPNEAIEEQLVLVG